MLPKLDLQLSHCCNLPTATSDVLRDLDLDPLVSSRFPCSPELPVKPTPPCAAPTTATVARRRQHADEAANKHADEVASPHLLCPLATSSHGRSSAHAGAPLRPPSPSYAAPAPCYLAFTTTIIAYRTPLLPSPTRPSSCSRP